MGWPRAGVLDLRSIRWDDRRALSLPNPDEGGHGLDQDGGYPDALLRAVPQESGFSIRRVVWTPTVRSTQPWTVILFRERVGIGRAANRVWTVNSPVVVHVALRGWREMMVQRGS